jgi:hypothetical protein
MKRKKMERNFGRQAIRHAIRHTTDSSGLSLVVAGLSGQQNTDTSDVSTHAALHVCIKHSFIFIHTVDSRRRGGG